MRAANIAGVIITFKKGKLSYTVPGGMQGKDFAIWQQDYSELIDKFIQRKHKQS